MKKFLSAILTAWLMGMQGASFDAFGQELAALQPTAGDKCIVCGMFVDKYPDWTGEIIFNDGRVLFFDGCKDLFKYCFEMEKFTPGRKKADIAAIFVTTYYDVTFIHAESAFFVTGSNVYGPMGPELIPFQNEADAAEFLKDHGGTAIIRFDDITPEFIDRFD